MLTQGNQAMVTLHSNVGRMIRDMMWCGQQAPAVQVCSRPAPTSMGASTRHRDGFPNLVLNGKGRRNRSPTPMHTCKRAEGGMPPPPVPTSTRKRLCARAQGREAGYPSRGATAPSVGASRTSSMASAAVLHHPTESWGKADGEGGW